MAVPFESGFFSPLTMTFYGVLAGGESRLDEAKLKRLERRAPAIDSRRQFVIEIDVGLTQIRPFDGAPIEFWTVETEGDGRAGFSGALRATFVE